MMPRPLLAVAPAVLALALLAGLTACATATAPAPRTVPNQLERDAVQKAVGFLGLGDVNPDIRWTQLWTLRQYPQQMQDCAAEASHGQLQVDAGPLPSTRVGYHIVGSGSEPNETEAGRIIDACHAQIPVDDRVLGLPSHDLPALYSYDLTVLRPCLISHGFDVARAPSRRGFLNLVATEGPWSPYDTVTVSSRAKWYSISDACPAIPPALAAHVASG